jgi:beta-phosphoglucomutase
VPCETQLAVIFDLDGVIVDTREGHHRAFIALGEEEGFLCSDDTFRQIFGLHNNDIFPMLYGHPLPAAEIDRLADRKEALFREAVRGTLQALPGVLTLVPALHAAGFRLAIGSSTPRANVDLVLDELGLTRFFSAISSAEDVTHGKPDPQVFLVAAARLGVPPAQCVVVEDAVAGVLAALAGGMKALAVTTNHDRAALSAAHRVVASLAEITPADTAALIRL